MKILVCCSGGGSNFRSIIESGFGLKSYEVSLLLVDRECGALEVARSYEIPYKRIDLKKMNGWEKFLKIASDFDLVVLAGFMSILGQKVLLCLVTWSALIAGHSLRN